MAGLDPNDPQIAAKMAVIKAACGLCAETEERLLRRLEALYMEGYQAGKNEMNALLNAIGRDLSLIVMAHLAGDADALKSRLDAFVENQVLVVRSSAPQTH